MFPQNMFNQGNKQDQQTNPSSFPTFNAPQNQGSNWMNNKPPQGSLTGQATGTSFPTSFQQASSSTPSMGFMTSTTNQPQTSMLQQNTFGQQSTGQQSTSYNILGLPQQIVQGGLKLDINSQRRQTDLNELMNVLQSYLLIKDPTRDLNIFKAFLYNRISKGYENYLLSFQNFKESYQTEDGKPAKGDYSLWCKATKENPRSNTLYPVQISSPEDLYLRTKSTKVFLMTATETLQKIQSGLISLNDVYDNEIGGLIDKNNQKLNLIKAKQLSVASKIEKLAVLHGKADKNFHEENKLVKKLNNLKSLFQERNDYLPKIEELKIVASNLDFSKDYSESINLLGEVDSKRREKCINTLLDMKKVFETTMSSL